MTDSLGKPLGDRAPTFETINLTQLQGKLQEQMPAVRMRETYGGGVSMATTFAIEVGFAVFPSMRGAEEYLAAAISRLQEEAIYGLGLKPKLRAMEDQVDDYRRRIETATAAIARKDALIASQQEEIDRLKNGATEQYVEHLRMFDSDDEQ